MKLERVSLSQDIPTIIRRDLLGTLCLLCEEGTYRVHAESYPDGTYENEDYVVCSSCEDVIERYRTKREIAMHKADGWKGGN